LAYCGRLVNRRAGLVFGEIDAFFGKIWTKETSNGRACCAKLCAGLCSE